MEISQSLDSVHCIFFEFFDCEGAKYRDISLCGLLNWSNMYVLNVSWLPNLGLGYDALEKRFFFCLHREWDPVDCFYTNMVW